LGLEQTTNYFDKRYEKNFKTNEKSKIELNFLLRKKPSKIFNNKSRRLYALKTVKDEEVFDSVIPYDII